MTGVRALTVRQPWAWAIAHGGKLVENRSRPVRYRGRLLIHAGGGWSARGAASPDVRAAWWPIIDGPAARWDPFPSIPPPQKVAGVHVHDSVWAGPATAAIEFGAIIATSELVDCHPSAGCCAPWGEDSYVEAGGRRRTEIWHLVLEDVRPLDPTVPAVGHLGLWIPPADVLDLLDEAA